VAARRALPDRIRELTPQALTRRDLNRATLARQLLLERHELAVPAAVERVAGLQAQLVNPPYIGLWSRIDRFERKELTAAMEAREVVRATFLRATLHVVSARDYLQLRAALEPALLRALYGFNGDRARALDLDEIVADARELLDSGPRTFAELRAHLAKRHPEHDVPAMAFAVRACLPLVQVAPAGTWGRGGDVAYAIASDWLGSPVQSDADPAALVLRHLAAFGPASVKDVQSWAGMAGLRDAAHGLAGRLVELRGEDGTRLLDLPDAPRPSGDVTAPVRFLPEYDNTILGHADRSRLIADEHRKRVYLPAGRVRATILIDGFVSGTWRVERTSDTTAVVVEPFARLRREARAELAGEGERLALFIGDGERAGVRFE
jgi:hypothetical protein